jgi:UPF0716 protein FxsA
MNVPQRRRRIHGWILLVAFIVVPLVEITVILRVGDWLGWLPTIALLILDSIIGTWLIRREGSKAWSALNSALASGTMPARELADGALILIGGTLMLTPGFVTDLCGMLLILPFSRPIARKLLTRVISQRLVFATPGPNRQSAPDVVAGEVVSEGP